MEILADAGCQGLGPHWDFKKNAPDWCEEMYGRQRKAHSSRPSEHMSDTVQASASLLSHQQTAALNLAQQM
ncbi:MULTISPECIES: hypothetical protein [unclassified Streptomyces]|uniref:hypothetical protein n=1 Tax=unclassified Streptomyces TaxID=2593676 RepID=UPI0030777151